MSGPRHFLDLGDCEPAELRRLVARAAALKADPDAEGRPLAGRMLAMIFEKPSTRTRVSFEAAMRGLGGAAFALNSSEMQLGRGESVEDTARVLSRYVDAVMIRAIDAGRVDAFARASGVPVINGLTGRSHPCQLVADVLTFEERAGPIAGRTVAWTGDGNNMACTWIDAAALFGFELRLACPPPLAPPPERIAWARGRGARIVLAEDPAEAVGGADCVVTDTWLSMGSEPDARRRGALVPYRVDDRLMALAKPEAVFLHCLPAHRGEEVTDSVIDGPQSAVWDEAENRMHAQKAILLRCLE